MKKIIKFLLGNEETFKGMTRDKITIGDNMEGVDILLDSVYIVIVWDQAMEPRLVAHRMIQIDTDKYESEFVRPFPSDFEHDLNKKYFRHETIAMYHDKHLAKVGEKVSIGHRVKLEYCKVPYVSSEPTNDGFKEKKVSVELCYDVEKQLVTNYTVQKGEIVIY